MTIESNETVAEPLRPPHERSVVWKCLQVFSRIVSARMFDLKVYGMDNVPREGGVLLLSNHQSYLDPVLLAVKLHRPMSYLAKASLFKNKYFAWLITSLNAFPIKQGTGDRAAIEEMIRRLKQGYLLNVFPEGHRTKDGEIGPIQRGVVLVLRKAPVPIVPVVIDGSFQAWPLKQKLFRSHRIRVVYGPALHFDGLKSEALIELIERTLKTMLADLREKTAAEGPWI